MPLTDGLRLRRADAADLPRIAELREAVGWSVHEWALRAVLEPPHARCLVAADGAGTVVGVGSGIAYGVLGFVGNMVVADSHRRQGVGGAILDAVIEFLSDAGVERLELYATSLGRHLYARHGFELTGPTLGLRLPRGMRPLGDVEVLEAGPEAAAELAAYDAPRFGGDRGMLLRPMLDDAGRPLTIARDGAGIVGYGWIRPDGDRLGPLVADTPEVASALIADAFRRMPQAEWLSVNLPAGNRLGAARLAETGATIEPWDGRMARGPDVPRRDDTIYGNLVGALG